MRRNSTDAVILLSQHTICAYSSLDVVVQSRMEGQGATLGSEQERIGEGQESQCDWLPCLAVFYLRNTSLAPYYRLQPSPDVVSAESASMNRPRPNSKRPNFPSSPSETLQFAVHRNRVWSVEGFGAFCEYICLL